MLPARLFFLVERGCTGGGKAGLKGQCHCEEDVVVRTMEYEETKVPREHEGGEWIDLGWGDNANVMNKGVGRANGIARNNWGGSHKAIKSDKAIERRVAWKER